MSKLPSIKGTVIDREALDRLERLENEIATFRGIRHLWANAAANGTQYLATKEDLMSEQGHRLWSIAGLALMLHSYAFPNGESPNTKYCRFHVRSVDDVPTDNRTVLVLVWIKVWEDDALVDVRDWLTGYHDAGWWNARTGERIRPMAWCEMPKPDTENLSIHEK